MAETGQNLTIQDLRAIIHGLKMSCFAFVDEAAQDQVKFLIAGLPSAEQLGNIAELPKDFNALVTQVGKIMQLIETYSERGSEFKARHITKKKLPPRYKTLEWKKTAWFDKDKDLKAKETKIKEVKEEEGMQQAASTNIVKSLIKASSAAEGKGHEALSGKLIRCAKKVHNDSITESEFVEAMSELEAKGFKAESREVIAALAPVPNPTGVGSGVAAVGRQVGQAVDQAAGKAADKLDAGAAAVGNWFKNKWQGAKDMGNKAKATYQEAAWTTKVQSTMKQLDEVVASLKKAVAAAAVSPAKQKSLQAILDRYNAAYTALTPAIQLAQAAPLTTPTPVTQPPAPASVAAGGQPPSLPGTAATTPQTAQPAASATPAASAQQPAASAQQKKTLGDSLKNLGISPQDAIQWISEMITPKVKPTAAPAPAS